MNTISLPWFKVVNHPWLSWIFATSDDESGNQDDIFNSDLYAAWNDDSDDDDDTSPKDDSDDKKKEESSTAAQKHRYRKKAEELEGKVKDLEEKLQSAVSGKDDTGNKGEKKAEEYLRNLMTQLLDAREKEANEKKATAQAQLDEELAELVDDNPELTKEQIIEAKEEYDVSPAKAVKILKKLATKQKPNLPKSRRGKGEIEKKETKEKKASSWSDALRDAKALLKD